ncbi:MAG: helix-turn-helix domain-containing protein [Faecalibacillus sp.]
MIQDFALNIKKAFHSLGFHFFDEPVFSQIEKIEHYCLNNITASSIHTHNGVSCKSSHLVYFRSYSRHYVSFHRDVHDDMMTIPVLYCKNDGHYHALLPNSIFVPHSSFSIFFILHVLSMKYFSSATVEKITEMFQISVSTLYRWIDKYNAYLRIFTFLKNRYHMHFFIHLIYDFCNVINDLFELNLHTLFQNDRTLFNQDP